MKPSNQYPDHLFLQVCHNSATDEEMEQAEQASKYINEQAEQASKEMARHAADLFGEEQEQSESNSSN